MPAVNWHHARVRDVADFVAGSFRTVAPRGVENGPRFIVGHLKGEKRTTVQAIRFPVAWSRDRCRTWASVNGFHVQSWEWANPAATETKDQRLARYLSTAADSIRRVLPAMQEGDTFGVANACGVALAHVQMTQELLGLARRGNPDVGEKFTTTQTHVREALAHLVQADKDIGAGQLAAAAEALNAAQEHIDHALDRIDEQQAEQHNPPRRNHTEGCEAERNPPKAYKPNADDHRQPNPADPGLRRYWLADARKRGVPAVEWKTHDGQFVLSYPKRRPADLAAWKETAAARIKDIGGKVIHWYAAPHAKAAKKHNPANPAAPRQLVRIGDVVELHLSSGRGLRFSRGERAMLVHPGSEKDSAGKVSIYVAQLRSRHQVKGGPHKTAERTFETWTGRLPKAAHSTVADVPEPGEFGKRVGTVKAIVYSSDKWESRGRRNSYIHDFSFPLPGLFEGPHGSFVIRGGGFRVTARGIVG